MFFGSPTGPRIRRISGPSVVAELRRTDAEGGVSVIFTWGLTHPSRASRLGHRGRWQVLGSPAVSVSGWEFFRATCLGFVAVYTAIRLHNHIADSGKMVELSGISGELNL